MSVAELKYLLEQAENDINRKEKRIKLLEQTIIKLGGTIPEDKSTGSLAKESPSKQDPSTEEASSPPSKKRTERSNTVDDVKLESEQLRSDDETSEEVDEEYILDSVSNTDTEESSITKKSNTFEMKSEIDSISDTLKIFENVTKEVQKSEIIMNEIETMTDMVKSINAMTNTVNKKYQNAETTTCIETIDETTMTLVETVEASVSTEDFANKLHEVEVQTEIKKFANLSVETEEVNVFTKQELDELLEHKDQPELANASMQTVDPTQDNSNDLDDFDDMVVEEMESEPVETHHFVMKQSNEDNMIRRIEEIKKEYSEHGIQTTVEYETNGIQTNAKVIEKDLYDDLLAENQANIQKYTTLLNDKDQEITDLRSKESNLKHQ